MGFWGCLRGVLGCFRGVLGVFTWGFRVFTWGFGVFWGRLEVVGFCGVLVLDEYMGFLAWFVLWFVGL